MHETVDLRYQVDREVAAALLRDRRAVIRDCWRQILTERDAHGVTVPDDVLDVWLDCLIAFIEHADSSLPAAVASHWRSRIEDSIDSAALTAVTMVLLGPAIRSGLGPEGVDRRADAVSALACATVPEFCGMFVRALMTGGAPTPDARHWYEISRQLAQDREHHATQLAILNEVSSALSSTLSLDELYRIIYEQVGRLVDTSFFYIGTIGEPGMMELAQLYYLGERQRETEGRPRPMGLTRVVIEQGIPLLFNDYDAACRAHGIEPVADLPLSGPLAWLGVPIVSGSKPIGIMAVMSPNGPFDEADADILAAVARQAGAAIQNARLYEAQIAQAQRLKTINRLSRAFATIREPGELMQQACDLIHESFGYACVSTLLYDAGRELLVSRAKAGIDLTVPIEALTLEIDGPGLIPEAARTQQPVLANDVDTDPRYLYSPLIEHTRAELAVPLLREGRLLGILDVQSPELNAFDERDIEMLSTIADQLAITLENADLFVQERKRRTELSLILEASQAANQSLVLDDVIQSVAEGIADAIGLPSCVVYLYDEEGDRLLPSAFIAREGSRIDTARVSQVVPSTVSSQLMQRALLAGHEASAIEMLSCEVEDELCRVLCPSAVLAVPLVSKHQFLGLALLIAHDDEYHFSQHQLRVAWGVAGSAALALENARLYTRSHTLGMAEERIRVARDIHDGIAQSLTAVSLNLEAAEQVIERKPERAKQKIGRALELTRATLDDARRSVLDLRASALQELTLTEAVQRRLQQFVDEAAANDRQIAQTFMSDTMFGRLSARLELSLYRVFEAALDNVAQHADATHIDVTLAREGDDVILAVRDNGRGFDVDSVLSGNQPGGRFGLVAIRERVRLLHGTLEVRSEGGAGTTIQVTVPFEPYRGAGAEDSGEVAPATTALLAEDGAV